MVFVVVDRFTKYVHFIPLAHLYIATKVAHIHAVYIQVTWYALDEIARN